MSRSRNICIIGDSHLAALKLGWDEMRPQYPYFALDMFGSPKDRLWNTEFISGKIIPTNALVKNSFLMTSSRDHIPVADYDAFCVVGCGFDVGRVIEKLTLHYLFRSKTQGAHLVSDGCFKTSVVEALEATLAAKICRMVRQGSRCPIFIFPQPFRSDMILKVRHPRGRFDQLELLIQRGDDKLIHDLFRDSCSEFSKKTGVAVIHQPDETRAGNILTKRLYNEGAVRLQPGFARKHKQWDCTHMNKDYGVAALRGFFATYESSNLTAA
jgi:hypothetical protein